MRGPPKRALWIGAGVVALVLLVVYVHFDLGRFLSVEAIKSSRDSLVALYRERPVATVAAFFALYVAVAALSLPGATILTLAAGAIFGLVVGVVLVSFASSLGALIAFLISRYLLRSTVQKHFGRSLAPIDAGMKRDGIVYLLTLRLVPAFPFWLVNLLVGLTSIGAARFYWVSQLGTLPGTAVYVNAGTQLAKIDKASDVLSFGLIVSFVLLALLPLTAKAVIGAFKRRKVYARWPKPARFDRNMIVIGAGSGGLVAAYIAATVKAKVTLIEGHEMGGDCLNTGCVPSKALIRAAKAAVDVKRADGFGIRSTAGTVDFAAVMARVHRVVGEIAPHDSVERYTELGVEVLRGHADITSPWTVAVTTSEGTRTLSTRSIVIAAGARPTVPPIPGLAESGYLTSETVWSLRELPRRLVVLGGGPIGCELAQAFARLGSKVTQIEMAERVMMREDADAAELVAAALRADGVELRTGHEALRFEQGGDAKRLIARHDGAEVSIEFDALLCALGRSPRVEDYGLEALGIALTDKKAIETDAFLRTRFPNIYAAGDVAGPFQFTHTAAHQAWYAAVNALFGRFKNFKADYSVIPWTTFTDPEVARVGLSEGEAREQKIEHEVTRYDLSELDRAITDDVARGFVKVLTPPGKDRILGVTIVGEHAGDLLAEFVLAMRHGLGLKKIFATIHTYPTLSEADKYAAGQWRRAHVPHRLLTLAERLHAWERG